MRAMQFVQVGMPLQLVDLPIPQPTAHQVLLKVHACGVCRTDLHIIDGELTQPKLPLVLGHQIVGTIVQPATETPHFQLRCGSASHGSAIPVTIAHIAAAIGENLCDQAEFTGYQIDGGYAEYAVADERFCFPIPAGYPDVQAAPLLCAGLIGYRSLRLAGAAQKIGLYGFGAAAHIVTQVAKYQGREVFAFTRPQDLEAQSFARELGADWAGPLINSRRHCSMPQLSLPRLVS